MIQKLISSLAVVLLLPCMTANAAGTADAVESPAVPAAKTADPGANKLPYRGKVSSVDAAAKTFSLKGRVFNVTAVTRILKDGAPADWSVITVGEEVRGQALKQGGKWDAVSVMVGAKAAGAKKAMLKPAEAAPSEPGK